MQSHILIIKYSFRKYSVRIHFKNIDLIANLIILL